MADFHVTHTHAVQSASQDGEDLNEKNDSDTVRQEAELLYSDVSKNQSGAVVTAAPPGNRK